VLSQVIVGEGESVLLQYNSTRMITDNQVEGAGDRHHCGFIVDIVVEFFEFILNMYPYRVGNAGTKVSRAIVIRDRFRAIEPFNFRPTVIQTISRK
jgi:hypothetical protein